MARDLIPGDASSVQQISDLRANGDVATINAELRAENKRDARQITQRWPGSYFEWPPLDKESWNTQTLFGFASRPVEVGPVASHPHVGLVHPPRSIRCPISRRSR